MILNHLTVAATIMAVTVFSASAQTVGTTPASPAEARLRVPLDIPLLLSGNFGELRSNHFHSGLDFKTQGRTGLPVYCAADGYVSRVVVSPWGFGRAVYVTHPDLGLTTVYGHLQSFSSKIDTPVRDRQYDMESFRIDTEFSPGEIPVGRGELIGRSGNAGSSGGPHLHMDVRDAITEHALDPMAYYRSSIKDNVAPEVRALALYPKGGTVDGGGKARFRSGTTLSQPFTAWGRVVPGIKAYDRMPGTTNIYGIKYMTLLLDGDTIYHRVIDHIDFDRSRAVNTLVEYGDVIDDNSWNMTTHVPQSQPLGDIVSATGDGSIIIDSERDYKLQFLLRDEHGNVKKVPFTIRGVKSSLATDSNKAAKALSYDSDHTLTATDGAKLFIPAGTMYDDSHIPFETIETPGQQAPTYIVGDRHTPLSGEVTLTLPYQPAAGIDPQRYIIARVDSKNPKAVATNHLQGNRLTARITRFGKYRVITDEKAPTITPVTPEKWRARGVVTYKISDNLSGIETYRGEIDGKWVMFELDGKTGTLSYKIDRNRLPAAKRHTVNLMVTDAAGNVTTSTNRF
ncbi:MAG: M23 family metallopeptidase [Clostridiales bacterium]|nr:M23 family metallopeptidase [Clostridiales bacterium]